MESFQLEEYLSGGVENIVKGILKASGKNPRESLFMVRYAAASQKSRALRQQAENKGEHIPPFLIASIATACNLHCKGCYARANQACGEGCGQEMLTDQQWDDIFEQAAQMGVGFILLAGGEPLTRPDVLRVAGKHRNILFPVFTNGTMFTEKYLQLFDRYRSLAPILSIEGDEETTDSRRGDGVYAKLRQTMEKLSRRGILYGASVTVTKQNIREVTSDAFVGDLYAHGCKAIIYVEYTPIDEATAPLAPDDADRAYLAQRVGKNRDTYDQMVFVSFPGDEKTSGGCLAAGRGFFHINAHGGAEPCPFSPYSDSSLLDMSLREALQSPLFRRLQEDGSLLDDHAGGCVLFAQREKVEQLAQQTKNREKTKQA